MKENRQKMIKLYDKFIYSNKTPKGWSIVIMPDEILIDNLHHGFAHIHPDRKEIKTENLEDTYKKVMEHVNTNKGVKYDKLRKELIR